MKTQLRSLLLATALVVIVPRLCSAADLGFHYLGLRGGVSLGPDQFFGGVFLNAGQVVTNLRLQPSFEFGMGNGVRIAAANADFLYPLSAGLVRPYVGGGLGINFTDVTNDVGESGGMEIGPVLNIIGGVEWGASRSTSRASHRYVLEARLGLGDTPDFKISAGLVF